MAAQIRTFSLMAALALTACAGVQAKDNSYEQATAAKDAAQLALFERHAGAPQDNVYFQQRIHGYEVVGPLSIIVWETVHKAWLVDLKPGDACRGLETEAKARLGSMHHSLNVNNTYIEAGHSVRCKVVQIREVDVKAVKADQRGGSMG